MSSSDHPIDMDLWLACMDVLEQSVPAQQFRTWIQPLHAQVEEGVIVLWVANRFKMDWVRKQYLSSIEKTLEQLADQPVAVELRIGRRKVTAGTGANPAPEPQVPERPAPARRSKSTSPEGGAFAHLLDAMPPVLPASSPEQSVSAGAAADRDSPVPQESVQMVSAGGKQHRRALQYTRLDSQRTFDNLVEGGANHMARAAAWHIALHPGQTYNPLFIYGGIGLGKTHLLQAAGNKVLENNSAARVMYRHAEQFVSDVVQASQRKTFDTLRDSYATLDMLLIDDIQFLAGKEKTLEEFLSIFEAILARKGHIVITGDTHPKSLSNMPDRLLSRFDSGFTVSIEPPDLDMRVNILQKKAEAAGERLPEDVAFFVANNVRANVRELEGALQNILAHSRFGGQAINIPLVRDALRDLLSIKNRQVGVENIQKIVADFYKIQVADMESKQRPLKIARPRQIAMYLSKELTQKSLPEIGALFGGRDHSTVLRAVRKISAEKNRDPELQQQLQILEQTIKG